MEDEKSLWLEFFTMGHLAKEKKVIRVVGKFPVASGEYKTKKGISMKIDLNPPEKKLRQNAIVIDSPIFSRPNKKQRIVIDVNPETDIGEMQFSKTRGLRVRMNQ